MIHASRQIGFSLIEIVVAVGIFMILGSGITFFATGSFSPFVGGGEVVKKQAFAKDAIHDLEIIADRDWSIIDANDSGDPTNTATSVSINKDSNGDWAITTTPRSETRGAFTRYIYISSVQRDAGTNAIVASSGVDDPGTKKVVVVITADGQADYQLDTYLINSNAVRMSQTNWGGSTGQAAWTDGTTDYFSSTGLTLGANVTVTP